MDNKKVTYSRQEKVAYYARRIAYLEMALERNKAQLDYAKKRLTYLQSDEYQDWDSNMAEELQRKTR